METDNERLNLPDQILVDNRKFRREELPKPYADPDELKSNLEAALNSDPRRKANYQRFQDAKRTLDIDYLPIKLDLENVSKCNYRCTMCQVSDWAPTYQRATDLTLEEFKELIDELYGLVEIKIQGMGEPLMGLNSYFEMIRYARSKHIWVRSSTNASLLHYNDNYKKIIDAGINDLQVSIDGATKETHEKIRIGSRFDLVKANCKLLNEYCEEKGVLRTRMWTVLQRDNLSEFFDLVDIAKELKFKRMTIALSLTEWGQDHWAAANQEVTVEDSITPDMAQKAIEMGQKLGVEVTFWENTGKYSVKSSETLCGWPFERSFVSSDMRVVPCCMIATPELTDLGDAHDFTDVWNGESYREFRRAHLEGRIPNVCRGCYAS